MIFALTAAIWGRATSQYSGAISEETRATLKKLSKMAAVQNQNSALPNLKNLTRENFGKLSNQQHKVSFVPLGYKRSISGLQNCKTSTSLDHLVEGSQAAKRLQCDV